MWSRLDARLEEAYEAEVARQGGLYAARPKAVFEALLPQFPELTLQVVKWCAVRPAGAQRSSCAALQAWGEARSACASAASCLPPACPAGQRPACNQMSWSAVPICLPCACRHLQGQRRREQAELRKTQGASSGGGVSGGGGTPSHDPLRSESGPDGSTAPGSQQIQQMDSAPRRQRQRQQPPGQQAQHAPTEQRAPVPQQQQRQRQQQQQHAVLGCQHDLLQPAALLEQLARVLDQEQVLQAAVVLPPGLEPDMAQFIAEREQLQRRLQARLHAPVWTDHLLPGAQAALQAAQARRQKLVEVRTWVGQWPAGTRVRVCVRPSCC